MCGPLCRRSLRADARRGCYSALGHVAGLPGGRFALRDASSRWASILPRQCWRIVNASTLSYNIVDVYAALSLMEKAQILNLNPD